jgi:hypothetical protein
MRANRSQPQATELPRYQLGFLRHLLRQEQDRRRLADRFQPHQFLARELRDRAELVVHESDFLLRIDDGHEGMLIERGQCLDDRNPHHLQLQAQQLQVGRIAN